MRYEKALEQLRHTGTVTKTEGKEWVVCPKCLVSWEGNHRDPCRECGTPALTAPLYFDECPKEWIPSEND